MKSDSQRCGFIAIIGRPNVGKSTLLNHLIGHKVSITSRKPQTTQHRITGILTEHQVQYIFVDTPGLNNRMTGGLSKQLNKTALSVLEDVDVLVWVLEALVWTALEEWVLSQLQSLNVPIVLVLNKIDQVKNQNRLLPFISRMSELHAFNSLVPICALKNLHLDQLKKAVSACLPESDFLYEIDRITDRPESFVVAELIREKIVRQMGDELPYVQTVQVEKTVHERHLSVIHAVIIVERNSHKAMVIGRSGQRIKQIGRQARLELQNKFKRKVNLQLWVKVKAKWTQSQARLVEYGYCD